MSLNILGLGSNPERKAHIFIAQAVKASGKTPRQIAEAMGYSPERATLVEMFMNGKSKLPINKVISFAEAVGLDARLVFETVMRDYSPDTLDVLQKIYGPSTGNADPR